MGSADRVRRPDDRVRFAERLVDVAPLQVGHPGDVARPVFRLLFLGGGCAVDRGVLFACRLGFVEDRRRFFAHRRLGIGDRCRLVVLDLDQQGGVDGRRLGLRDHRGHRLTCVEHALAGERQLRAGRLELGQVGARDHVDDAWRVPGGARVDASDAPAGDVGEDQLHVQQAHDLEVGGEACRAADLFRSFLAPPPSPGGYAHQRKMLPAVRARRFVAALSIAIAACSNSSPVGTAPSPLAGNQALRFPIQQDLATLDPAMIDDETEAAIAQNLFDGLLKFDNNLNVAPDVAARLPDVSADGLTYTFKLRSDAKFSNGDAVTSADVLYSWNRAAAMQGPYAANLEAIAGYGGVASNQASGAALEALLEKQDPTVTLSGLSAPDAETVVVKLSGSAGWFESAIAQHAAVGMIVDQKIVKNDFDGWWKKPATLVGTGAFTLTAHTPGQSYDFAAVAGWWGRPRPTLKSVHVDVVAAAETAMTKYRQGGFDLFGYAGFSPPAADVAKLPAAMRNELLLAVKNKDYWVSFNLVADAQRTAAGPFTIDGGRAAHDLRLAFSMAVDRAQLVKDVCASVTCVAATGGLIPKGLLGYLGDGSDPLANFDPVKARALLHSADPLGSKSKGLVYAYDPEGPFNDAVGRFLQTQWRANLGVSVTLETAPHSRFLTERLSGHYVLSRDGWAAAYNHPQDWFDNLWGAVAGCPDTSCTTGYDTRAYDQLLTRADAEPPAASVPDYKTLSRQLIDDVAYIPLFYPVDAFLFKAYVLGAGSNNMFDYWWDQIQLISHQ
jgi:oligopeptide transport system substrate-binding protein